jgi:hypothetical protein
VLDIAGRRNALGNKTLPITSGLVDRVRVREPAPGVVRIIVDVKPLARYRIVQEGASITIIIDDAPVVSRVNA